jgi:hypothetical protein
MSGPVISPETRVGDLLDAYPGAEDALIGIAPKFKALRNPVLRRTVAKVATLEQAARVADMPVNDLVRQLRAALGQEVGGAGAVGTSTDTAAVDEAAEAPAWVAAGASREIDADHLLASGKVPVARATELLAGMPAGSSLLVRSSFRVEPLIDVMRNRGHQVFTRRVGDDAWEAWVRKA